MIRNNITLKVKFILLSILFSFYNVVNANYFDGLELYNKKEYTEAFSKWSKLASDGDINSKIALGVLFEKGLGVSKDYKMAFDLYAQAAAQGSPLAQRNLGVMYDQGKGVPKDYKKAFEWYEKSAKQGNAAAQYSLGSMYGSGHGVSKDRVKSIKWIKKSANQNYSKSQYALGLAYEYGTSTIKQDNALALDFYKKSIKSGKLSNSLEKEAVERILKLKKIAKFTKSKKNNGKGFKEKRSDQAAWKVAHNKANHFYHALGDYENALKWYLDAKGLYIKENNLASDSAVFKFKFNDLKNKLGNNKFNAIIDNYKKIVLDDRISSDAHKEPYIQPSDNNKAYKTGTNMVVVTMYNKGVKYYEDGRNRLKGFKLILKAANYDFYEAQHKLGDIYSMNGSHGGLAIDYSDKEAFKWYKKSANQGYAPSQYEVGAMYHYGEGTSKNNLEAIKWYTKAALQNQADAQYELGQMYANGQGVSIDYQKAIKWYRRAAEHNDTRASNKVKELLSLEERKVAKNTFVDTSPPEIRTYNSDSFTTTEKYITLSGDIKDDSKIAELTINGKEIAVKNDGFNQFSVAEYIQLGRNVFNIASTDVFGNKSTKAIVFNREKVLAINKDKRLAPPTTVRNSNPNAIALIIGVDEYESITSAPWAESDASVFYDYAQNALGISDDRIRLITGPESSETGIWKSIERWLPTEVDKNKSDVYVYFAGHGLASADGNNAYLIPWDGDPDLLERTAILRSELIDGLKDLDAKNVTLFMDTCYSGKARGGKGTLVADSRGLRIVKKDKLYNLPNNFTLFSAAGNDETASSHPSLKHGLFSYWMMRGLGGEADSNNDRKITNGELHAFIDKNVQKNAVSMGRKQHPQLVGNKDKVIASW